MTDLFQVVLFLTDHAPKSDHRNQRRQQKGRAAVDETE